MFLRNDIDINRRQRVLLSEDEIHLVIAIAPVENIEAVDKRMADKICADSGLERAFSRPAVNDGRLNILLESVLVIYQRSGS